MQELLGDDVSRAHRTTLLAELPPLGRAPRRELLVVRDEQEGLEISLD